MRTRRKWAIGAAVVIGVVLCWIFFVQPLQSQRRFEALKERLREEGRPVELADFDFEMPDIEENAAYDYRLAVEEYNAAFGVYQSLREIEEFKDSFATPCRRDPKREIEPWTEEEITELEGFINYLEPAWEFIVQAGEREVCLFGNYSDPAVFTNLLSDLGEIRAVARAIELRAKWELHNKNYDVALEWAARGFRLSEQTAAEGALIAGMVRIAVTTIALNELQDVLYDAPIDVTVPPEITAFLDNADWGEAARHALATERVLFSQYFIERPGDIWESFLRPSMKFHQWKMMIGMEDAATIDYLDERHSAIADIEATYPLNNSGSTVEIFVATIFSGGKLTTAILLPAIKRGLSAYDRAQAETDLARIAIRLREYKRENGNYPNILDELRWDDIPADRFGRDGEPYLYRRDGGDGFVLSSRGHDRDEDPDWMGPVKYPDGDIMWCAAR